jgi:integrase
VRTSKPGSPRCLHAESRPRPQPLPRPARLLPLAGGGRGHPQPDGQDEATGGTGPPIPVLGEPQLRALFAVCAGKDFDARRDTALLMMLLDAGPRRAELLGMRVDDLNLEYDVVRVVGKGGRERALPFGRKTALALCPGSLAGSVVATTSRSRRSGPRPPS